MTLRSFPIDLDGEQGDLSAFSALDDLADAAEIAFIVEMDHVIHERHPFRLLCIRYLASHGWTWFGEELDWQTGDRIDDFLRTGDDALLEPVDDGRWYTSGMFAAGNDDAVRAAIAAERRRAAHAVRRAVPRARWFGVDSGGTDAEYLKVANAVETWDEGARFMAYREELMHVRLRRHLRNHPGEKVALMAGSTHLAKDDATLHAPGLMPAGGGLVPTVGHLAAHELTDRPVLSFWLLHGGGRTGSPWLADTDGRLVVPPESVNAELAAIADGRPQLVVVEDEHTERTVAGMHGLTMTCRLSEQVDAIVFAPEVTPASE
ncbi:MAG TPA: hypothetical protein VEA78_06840 [Acidimicrobiales bacterium]|nr:hypothetical protein [Acidimicrobiales bacterium]